jgi:hypothetical protein
MGFSNIDKIILAKAGSAFTQKVTPMGLRQPGKFMLTEESVDVENEVKLSNFVKAQCEVETVQCDYAMLKTVMEDFLTDGMVEAHIAGSPQQAAADGRGLKGNEVFQFAWAPGGNGYLGIKFKYTEEFTSGKKNTSAMFTLPVSLEKAEMDTILAAALVNASALNEAYEYTKVNPNNIIAIEYPGAVNLFEKSKLESFKLELESQGDGETIYGRPNNDYVLVTVEIITKIDSGIENYRSIFATAQISNLYIYEKISATETILKQINAPGRQIELELADKRSLKVTFKKKYPLYNPTFSTSVAGGMTTKKLLFA